MASQRQPGSRRGGGTSTSTAAAKPKIRPAAQSGNGAATTRSRSAAAPAKAVPGKAVPGNPVPGKAVPGKNGANGDGRGAASRGTASRPTASRPTGAGTAVASSQASTPAGGLKARLRSIGWVPLATFILSLYGLGASVYLTVAHYDTHVTLVCSDKGVINCGAVTTSSESIVFGIFPVAVLGLAFYVFMAVVNSPWGWKLRWPVVGWARLASVIVGIGFVLYLIYAELIEINAICLWCTSVHVATFLIFALVVFRAASTPATPPPPAGGGARGSSARSAAAKARR